MCHPTGYGCIVSHHTLLLSVRPSYSYPDHSDVVQATGSLIKMSHTLMRSVLIHSLYSCAAAKYSLPSLQRLALRKQGLHTGIQCSTILASARFAYAHTPDTESKLRAHYLALIIRCRGTFKRSGTMQMEMEKGGKLFFDLFVAMCNHMVCSRKFSSCMWDWGWH